MATRSIVAKKNSNGSSVGIYVHYDGSTHMEILQEYYSTPEKVDALIALGSLSVLGSSIGQKQEFTQPDQDTCVAYHRDRGESWEQVLADNDAELRQQATDLGCEYIYRYSFGGVWFRESI
jgi:hypothetical protein